MVTPEEILVLEMRRVKVKDLLEYLTEHDSHYDRSGPKRIAWNIKVRCNEGDLTDTKIRKEYGLQDKWDEKWEEELKDNHDLFGWCCEDGLDFVGDTHDKKRSPMCPWTTKEGNEFDYEIWQAGRSGGWLELHHFEGDPVDMDSLEEQYEGLCETEERFTCSECEGHLVRAESTENSRLPRMTEVSRWVRDVCHDPQLHTDEYYYRLECGLLNNEDWLEKLVRFCKSLDEFDASKELAHQFAYRRQQLEEEWEEEEKKKIAEEAEAEELYLAF